METEDWCGWEQLFIMRNTLVDHGFKIEYTKNKIEKIPENIECDLYNLVVDLGNTCAYIYINMITQREIFSTFI